MNFRNNLSMTLIAELVNHHATIATNGLQPGKCALVELCPAGSMPKRLKDSLNVCQRRSRIWGGMNGLDIDCDMTPSFESVESKQSSARFRLLFDDRFLAQHGRLHDMLSGTSNDVLEQFAKHHIGRSPEDVEKVRACMSNDLALGKNSKQCAVRLDSTRDMDWLAFADRWIKFERGTAGKLIERGHLI